MPAQWGSSKFCEKYFGCVMLLLANPTENFKDALALRPDFTFVCGSDGFVEAVTGRLLDLGLIPETIRTERFGG
jgi:ferredoxin-NADP reductase